MKFKRYLSTFSLSFILLFLATTSVSAASFYTSTSGSDSNSGTSSSPFRTINKGVSILHAGDTLFVKAGTYAEQLSDSIPSGTSWTNAVTIKANPGDIVTIKPPSSAMRVVTFAYGEKYIIIDDFIMDGANMSSDVIKFQNNSGSASANHIRISNSEVMNGANMGILIAADDSVPIQADFNEFINLKVHNNGKGDTTGNHLHGMYIQTNNNLVDGGSYYSNASHGIQVDSCHGVNGNNNIFRNLKLHDNGTTSGTGNPANSIGIGIYCGNNNLVYNVVAWNNGGNFQANWLPQNTKFYNDVGYKNFSSNYGNFFIGSGANGTLIKNSIGFQGAGSNFVNNAGATSQNNLFGVDPLFVDAANANFALKSGSPAIDAGQALSEVTTDINGVTRPQGGVYDIGAYEFGGTVSPTASPTVAPTNNPTSTPTPTPDRNSDGKVDGVDYVLYLNNPVDLNSDGKVDQSDLSVLILNIN